MSVKEVDLFNFIHTMEVFSANSMQRWNSVSKINLGITSIIVLSKLRDHGPLRGVEIAKKLNLTAGAITNITNKLYDKNYISRNPDPNSRRSIYYSIKPEGLEVLKEAKETGYKMQLEVMQVLTMEEQEQLITLYKKINESFADKKTLE
ncbi:MAG: MarR family winged helix-turn-helix transcriptional regulator [Candidatus Pristimantibacillus sp.]